MCRLRGIESTPGKILLLRWPGEGSQYSQQIPGTQRKRCNYAVQHSCSPTDNGDHTHRHSYRTARSCVTAHYEDNKTTHHFAMARARWAIRFARQAVFGMHTKHVFITHIGLLETNCSPLLAYFEIPGQRLPDSII